MTNETFTIISTGAPLIEVDGDGPTTDRPGGINVPDGVPTTAPIDLLNAWVRRWRIDAPQSKQANVTIIDSPFGAFMDVRCCVPTRVKWWRYFAIDRWPRLHAVVRRRAPSLAALWTLLTDDAPAACNWTTVETGNAGGASARGGDLVVVTFIVP